MSVGMGQDMDPETAGDPGRTTVFYDGSCPLCAREIAFYRRRQGAGALCWIDVSRAPDGAVAAGLSRERARARFHLRRSDGVLVSGGAAFAELWAALPAFRPLGRLFRSRGAVWLLDRSYDGFLHLRPLLQRLLAGRAPSARGGVSPPDRRRRSWLKMLARACLLGPAAALAAPANAARPQESGNRGGDMLIDDFAGHDPVSKLGTRWRAVSDQVMGGISQVSVTRDTIDGRSCLRLTGEVRLENNGGFIQAALDLAPSEEVLDAADYRGVRLVVRGNGARYAVHLRTPDNVRPWQSYRAEFDTGPQWQSVEIPFGLFEPYRLQAPLDVGRLRRIGLVAIGRAFTADLAVAEVALYR